jgi:NADPH-dependent 2,4-dienoyl-CoA reductase/sulfur reductase-like enzyme
MTERMVVIGGNATGMSAASQAKRLRGDDLEVIALERGTYTSYSSCGIPYWVAGDVKRCDDLVARTPEEHRRRGIDVRLRTEVERIDLDAGEVAVRDLEAGTASTVGFDQLVLATGARAVRPNLPGIDAAGIHGVAHLDAGAAVLADLDAGVRHAVVVGGGYIGIEMAEALVRRGVQVVVVDRAPEPMGTLDPDMGIRVREAMEGIGMDVRTSTDVLGFTTDDSGRVSGVRLDGGAVPADLVLLGLGVQPEVTLARDAGLPIGDAGGIRTDRRQRVVGHERVWAGGDCVEVYDRVGRGYIAVALGTHANKHGRVIGRNIGGAYASFPGVLGTAVSKVCNLEIGRTGLGEEAAAVAGFDAVAVTIESTTRAGYFPGAAPMWVKLLAERGTGRLLGGQIVGRGEGAAKRIDVVAAALWNDMTVADLADLDLGYAPPFSSVRDPVAIAAGRAASAAASEG